MIKKALAYLGIALLLVVAYILIIRGLVIGGFEILSFKQMIETKNSYDEKISSYDVLLNDTYQSSLSKLEVAKSNFERNKASYEELKEYSSYEELLELTRDRQYPIEFLWIKLDLIARNNNLDSKYTLANSSTGESKDLQIELVGSYLSVKNYIYDMLIDLDLQFRAENITIIPSGNSVKATFTVKDLKVVM